MLKRSVWATLSVVAGLVGAPLPASGAIATNPNLQGEMP
jgi:hypothetical protein